MTEAIDNRRQYWNQRYSEVELLWSAGPNQFLADEVADLRPGRALDLGAGEGRNAMWLAERGWGVTAVDFSDVAIAKGKRIASERRLDVEWVVEDLLNYRPKPDAFDLVIILYIHLPAEQFARLLAMATVAMRTGATLLVLGHDAENIAHGVGGPQDPALLYNAETIVDCLDGLRIIKAGQRFRPVTADDGERNAIDVLVRAERH